MTTYDHDAENWSGPPPASTTEVQLASCLRRIIRSVDIWSRRLVDRCGLTGPQLAVLRAVVEHGPVTPGAVSKLVSLSQPTLTGIVSRLLARGLLSKAPSGTDRRSVLLEATEAGRQLAGASPALLDDRFRARFAELPAWEQLQMLATLERLAWFMTADERPAAAAQAPPTSGGPARAPGWAVTDDAPADTPRPAPPDGRQTDSPAVMSGY